LAVCCDLFDPFGIENSGGGRTPGVVRFADDPGRIAVTPPAYFKNSETRPYLLGIHFETTISVRKLRGIVTIPGWLNGTGEESGEIP
jgi:hypothetical protein